AVVADSQAEELHQFTRVVFIRPAFDIAVRIEPDQHRPVLADRLQKWAEATQSVLSQQAVLAKHKFRVLDLDQAGCEMVVPEQGQLLAERVATVKHAVKPPTAQLISAVVGGRCDLADVRQGLFDFCYMSPSPQQQVEGALWAKASSFEEIFQARTKGRPAI